MRALRTTIAVVLTLGAAGAAAGPVQAAGSLKTGMADDRLLLRNDDTVEATARQMAALGVDSVRLHARWIAIAPRPLDQRRPVGFDATDPQDPRYQWAPLDRAVTALRANGIEPMLAVTGSGPVWASLAPSKRDPRYKPSPKLYGQFAGAVAQRYAAQVSRYLIWNEPNIAGWLLPQQTCRGRRCTPASPAIYRELFRAGASAIRTRDRDAQVMVGTLAPRGSGAANSKATVRPLAFLRSLGCVTTAYRRDRKGACRTAKPIRADGFAYHPHGVRRAPDERAVQPDDAAIADLKKLERALDRTTARGLLKPVRGARFDIHLTEFGYQTSPPDRTVGVTLSRQARWVQQATFLAWRDPRIKTITQYELQDEPVARSRSGVDPFAAWQSGLLFVSGKRKPLYAAFANPFWVEVTKRKAVAQFWGQVRPGASHVVKLQRRAGSGWRTVRQLTTTAAGYWTTRLAVRSKASYRFTYVAPGADGTGTRTVTSASQSVAPRR